MDVVGSEIGQKMRSAIKAKLTELGCYVDDELPDYVMVMVANKRTRAQMEDDLQLFLGDNTELFVNWLHQVLKKLQEVTVTTPLKQLESERNKERSLSKERKPKEKKEKEKSKKSDTSKKAKKKEKVKIHRKKEDKKVHKSKKKSKHHEMIRPNVPPLLMNIEKESEPSITDVFAGQILKNHGIILDSPKEDVKVAEKKPVMTELKRPIIPIIDPATITSQPESAEINSDNNQANILEPTITTTVSSMETTREEQIKEINEIDAKIQGLKQKLVEQLDSMSDDEDFLNIRTEAEELMNDFAEDVFQEVSQPVAAATPPLSPHKSPIQTQPIIHKSVTTILKETPETLPQIELNLPKRPVRERLGSRELKKIPQGKEKETEKRADSSERFTPERESEFRSQSKSAKSRLGDVSEPQRKISISDDTPAEKPESSSKRLTSKVSVLEGRACRSSCASVVHVRPRPRVPAPASSLLLRAVADAHKSLLNIPPKVDMEPQKVKRALVLPMRRCLDPQKIVIQIPTGDAATTHRTGSDGSSTDETTEKYSKSSNETRDSEEYVPAPITKKIINNTEYAPLQRSETRTASLHDDTLIVETINIHNPTTDKTKDTQFIVTMNGYHPNAFLAKKLMTEGLLDEGEEISKGKVKDLQPLIRNESKRETKKSINEPEKKEESKVTPVIPQKKRVSETVVESDTQVVVKQEDAKQPEKRKSIEISFNEQLNEEVSSPKKRRGSPIVFNVEKKDRERQRTESSSSDNHVTVTTTSSSHKYDTVPPLSLAERKLVPCRLFPLCRYGALCAFAHPRCKFAAGCTRRGCVYEHAPRGKGVVPPAAAAAAAVASHVVPVANYKTISAGGLPGICKFYPNCVNPACHFFHPKPCRYGANCLNKLECNFYHNEAPVTKWRYPV